MIPEVSSTSGRALVLLIFMLAAFAPGAMAQANVQGQWSTLPYLMPINPVHVALLNNGKVLIVAGSGNCPAAQPGCPSGPPFGPANSSGAAVWDPASGTFTQFSLAWDMFCNGMAHLPDGRVLITGGTLQYDPFHGALNASIFDPATNTFTDTPNMAHGRWYPTVTALPDGRVMTFSGLDENGNTNPAVEFYTVGSGWSQQDIASWTPPLYPRMHVLPSGQVFYSGYGTTSALFDPVAMVWTLNVASTQYQGQRVYGSSVLLPLMPANNYDAKVMILGGGNPSTATTEIIDMGASSPAWQFGPSMSQPRIEMNATIMPNGKVIALGGSLNDEDTTTASLNADVYDPVANTISSGGADAYARLYHSISLLLPDATVLFAGGNPNRGSYEPHMEIYKPAYLFNSDGSLATRPAITSAPASVSYGNTFTVQTPDAASISTVVLARLGSPTHAFDQDQRLVGMNFTQSSGLLNVTAPPNGNVAPPGYYMLFILNGSGVPSVSQMVQVAQQPDFSISATPGTQSVLAGGIATYTVPVAAQGGFSGTVGLGVSGLPTGATVNFNPTSVSGSGTSTMTVTTGSNTPLGSSTLTVTGTSGALSHQTAAVLQVTSAAAPGVSSVAPTGGPVAGGTAITITGTNFVSGATVTLGGTAATNVVVVSATQITATTPAHAAGAVTVVVTNPGSQTGSLANGFTYAAAPGVSSVAPTGGPVAGGTAITITGTNFVSGAAVTLGGTAATNVVVVSATQITATTPAHAAGAVTVVVTNPDTQTGSLSNGFTYAAAGGGINFGQVAASTPQSPTQVVTLSFPGAQTAGDLNVVVVGWNDATSTVQSVTDNAGNVYNRAIGPTSGAGVQQSIYYAANIAGGNDTVTVQFNQAAAYPDIRILEYQGVSAVDATAGSSGNGTVANSGTATTKSATELIFGAATVGSYVSGTGTGFSTRIITSPDGDNAEDEVVTTTGSYSAGAPLGDVGPWVMQMVTFQTASSPTAPAISSVTPNSGPVAGGTAITITGTNFVSGATVTLGGIAATNVVVVEGGTQITATTPANAAGAVTVVVTNPNTQTGSLANGFTYAGAPGVASVSPIGGPVAGGTAITITGTNFASGATVTLGGTAATSVVVVSATQITAKTPAHAAGAVTVVVTNPGSQTGSLANGFTYAAAPGVSSVAPTGGPVAGGTAITITGTNFVSGAAVTLGGTAATNVVVVSATQITAATPAHAAGAVTVVVTNPDTQTGSLASGFTYAAAPTVSSVSPNAGAIAGGTGITITGTKFISGASVTLGGTAATNVVVVSATQITATTPAHAAGGVTVVVTNPDTQTGSLANGFTYATAPGVSSVAPIGGPVAGGTAITITGTNFASGATVTLGGTAATSVVVVSATQITAKTPAHAAGAVTVVVTNPGSQTGSLTNGFSYAAAPGVSSVAPTGGPVAGGTAITITGSNFVSGATVALGGTAATNVVVVSGTQITATTPAHAAGAVTVVVTNPDTQTGSLASGFTYAAAPTVSSVSPNAGSIAGGTAITITGTKFVSGATVTLGGTAATNVVVVSATQITATTPAHAAGAVTVVVTNPDTQTGSLANGFTYATAPGVSSVAPIGGPVAGGTAITITGTNFASGATVTLGGTAATNVVVVSGTQITAKTPAHAAGAVTVVVTNPGSQTGSLANGFTYAAAPGVSSVSPTGGPVAGGTAITITGTNFVSGATVTLGGTAATNVVVVSATQITATTPAHAAGAVTLVVTNPDTQTGSLASGFTYAAAPGVSSVAPTGGPIAGGTAITITGTNFVSGATVTLGGTAATNVVVVSATQITATTPAHAAGAVTVVVTNPGSQTGSLANGFAYAAAPGVSSVAPTGGPVAGGTAITITGANFVSGATVALGGTAATNVVVVSATQITATTPAHAAGAVTVVVTNPDTQTGSLANGFTYAAAGGGINFGQVAASTPQSPTQVVTLSFPGAQTAGDLNVVVVGWNDATSTVQSVTDNAGNVYNRAIGPTSGAGVQQSIYYAANIAGGNDTVTVQFNQAAAYPDIRILEYQGVSAVDATAGSTGGGTAANSGTATTTSATELIFGAATVGSYVSGTGTGFSTRIITSPDGDNAEDEVVTTTGSYSAGAPLGDVGPWVMQMVTFK